MDKASTKCPGTAAAPTRDDDITRIGRNMTRLRLMTGRRLVSRMVIQSMAPDLELSHLDVLDIVGRGQGEAEMTVGTIADLLRIDPSRASRVVADMVARDVLRREASQADARRSVVVLTEIGHQLLKGIKARKMGLIDRIVADWPKEDVETFAGLFERFISGYEDIFPARDGEVAGEGTTPTAARR